MNIIDLDTHCVESILSLSSDNDVCTFDEAFPEHLDAVNAFWARKSEVNVDDTLLRDAAMLLKIAERRRKLKRVTFKRGRNIHYFSKLPAVIARNCSDLEVLDIPGIVLSAEDVRLLGSCISLKQLNIKYSSDFKTIEFVEKLVANNPQLEGICLEGRVTKKMFENLPVTIKRIEDKMKFGNDCIKSFWIRVQTWRLENLKLNVTLNKNHIIMLSTQTTLKYLSIRFEGVGNSLETLFRNNPGLEEVSLDTSTKLDGICLKYLPPILKCLQLSNMWILDEDAFIECVKTWKLQSFSYYPKNINFLMRVLEAAPSLCEVSIDLLSILPHQNFTNIEKLAQLKILNLNDMFANHNDLLKILLQSCVNLEQLNINTLFFDSEIFSMVATFPKLKECSMSSYRCTGINYDSCMQDLSRSKSLSTVALKYPIKSKTDVLVLIRGCTTFTKLSIHINRNINVSKNFLENIVLEMEKQTERREILTIEIIGWLTHCAKFHTENLHPMLNLVFIDVAEYI